MENNKGLIDAKETIKYLSNREFFNSKYNCVYRITNENINGYLKSMDVENKNILSVGASGDQYLECLLYHPNNIELFDINTVTYYYIILKLVAAKVLSLDDFLNFFIIGTFNVNHKEYFNYNIYLKIKAFLPKDVKEYWDFFYKYESDKIYGISEKSIFFENANLKGVMDKLKYLEYNNYKKIQSNLEKMNLPKFYIYDIIELVKILNQKYDIILTSNIDDYANYPWFPFIRNKLSTLLNKNGKIQTCYKWFDAQYIYDDFELLNLPSLIYETQDCCLIYTKR